MLEYLRTYFFPTNMAFNAMETFQQGREYRGPDVWHKYEEFGIEILDFVDTRLHLLYLGIKKYVMSMIPTLLKQRLRQNQDFGRLASKSLDLFRDCNANKFTNKDGSVRQQFHWGVSMATKMGKLWQNWNNDFGICMSNALDLFSRWSSMMTSLFSEVVTFDFFYLMLCSTLINTSALFSAEKQAFVNISMSLLFLILSFASGSSTTKSVSQKIYNPPNSMFTL